MGLRRTPACRSAPATRALTYPTAVLPYVWLALESDWLNAAFFAVSVAAAAAVLRVAALCTIHHEEYCVLGRSSSVAHSVFV